jgi:peptidoglycan hydrolase-like protein with peptidoglycan-binding domain
VRAFQEANGLSPTGIADAGTTAKLRQTMPGDAVTTYAITAEDADGPFTRKIPGDMMEKAKLPALRYASVLELLGPSIAVLDYRPTPG